MSGYLLFICQKTFDHAALSEYWRGVEKSLEDQDVEHVITYGAVDRLEGLGDVEGGVQVLRFPTFERAKAWYTGAAHQAIKPLAQKGGKFFCAVMESGRWAEAKDRMPHTIGRTMMRS